MRKANAERILNRPSRHCRRHCSLPRKAPLGKIAQQAVQLPQKRLQAAVRGAVPCMDGGVLGHQIRLAPGAHLLGQVGVLHIHEVVLIKAAHGLEGCGIHRREAAGAELDLGGAGQVPVCHQIALVILGPKFQAGQLAVYHGPHAAPAQRQTLWPAVREGECRPRHHYTGVCRYPVCKVTEGVLRQLDVRVQDEVHPAVQQAEHRVVSGAEAAVLCAAEHLHLLVLADVQGAVLRGLCKALAAAVRAGVVPVILPKTIPLPTIELLLSSIYHQYSYAATDFQRKNALRDAAVIELLFATGIRISELCSITPDDINLSNRTLLIFGKGSKERLLQIGNDDVVHTLLEYRKCYLPDIKRTNRFFVNQAGRPLSDQYVRRTIRKYCSLASIDMHITPHMFRHTFATSLLEADVDIRYIQEMLGHSSIHITEIYTHVSTAKQRDILMNKHPRKDFRVG